MPKPLDVKKVIDIFEKSDIEEMIKAYHELKKWLSNKLEEHTASLQEEQNKFLDHKDKL